MSHKADMPTWEQLTPQQQYDLDRLFRRLRELKRIARSRMEA